MRVTLKSKLCIGGKLLCECVPCACEIFKFYFILLYILFFHLVYIFFFWFSLKRDYKYQAKYKCVQHQTWMKINIDTEQIYPIFFSLQNKFQAMFEQINWKIRMMQTDFMFVVFFYIYKKKEEEIKWTSLATGNIVQSEISNLDIKIRIIQINYTTTKISVDVKMC